MHIPRFDLDRLLPAPGMMSQYQRQLARLRARGKQVDCIESAVASAITNLDPTTRRAFIIYGEPQSGKTEMMICLTAKLLDDGRTFILHLLNDSVDLLGQNLGRFQSSGLAPSAKNFTDILDPAIKIAGRSHVVFCKKNARDLARLHQKLGPFDNLVIVDDEADYASPNSTVNKQTRTRINDLITSILGTRGSYIGVTATPARLDLNNTFDNDSGLWVDFPPHSLYKGQDTFFPLAALTATPATFRLTLLPATNDSPQHARRAFFGFLLSVAYLNTAVNTEEENYSMLIHTSGRKLDHKADWAIFDKVIAALVDKTSSQFSAHVKELWSLARERYPAYDADALTRYVVQHISRYAIYILNSDRDFVQNGASATNPASLLTIIIGGNIVSRGVTFENLLSMFFTRDVKHRLQQDTYIQRARMFGSRGAYLEHFELTIPALLYADWHRCFVFHRLSLAAIKSKMGSPVWLGDSRIAAVASASIDRSTVDLDRGEMAFRLFEFDATLDALVVQRVPVIARLEELATRLGEAAFPRYLISYILQTAGSPDTSVALHPSSSVDNYRQADGLDKSLIERRKGFIGATQLNRFPDASHHLKIFTNAEGKGRLFYKFTGSIQFMKNMKR